MNNGLGVEKKLNENLTQPFKKLAASLPPLMTGLPKDQMIWDIS